MNAYICDICKNSNMQCIPMSIPSSMRSDGLIMFETLLKYHCNTCGVLKGGNSQPLLPYFRSNGKSVFEKQRHCRIATGLVGLFLEYSVSQTAKVLEIGAASFETALEVQKLNPSFVLTAIEQYPESLPLSANEIKIIIGDFIHYSFQERFDVIYSNQVMEHISDPLFFLEKSKQLLSENGIIFICCPSFLPASNELLFTDHLYHFTPQSIEAIGHRIGLKLIDYRVAGWDRFSFIYILKKSGNIIKLPIYPDPNKLYFSRKKYLNDWCIQESLLLEVINDKKRLLLYGAGEFSQLIRAYLPTVYSKVSMLVVDETVGVRGFDKTITRLTSNKISENQQIIIGSHPSSRSFIKQKLINIGFKENQILQLVV